MSFVDVSVQKAFNEIASPESQTIEFDLDDEVLSELSKYGIQDAPLSIQNHFIHRWYHLRKKYIDIIGWQKVGYEIRYFYKRENQTAAFKYWINGKRSGDD